MILQIDITLASVKADTGFYRIMYQFTDDDLPSYWMFNGVWHHRRSPILNPPKSWLL